MYTENRRMSTKLAILLAAPFAVTVIALACVLALAPIPTAGRIPIYGVMLLEFVVGFLLLVSLSRVRIVVNDQALTIAFRILFTKRIALGRIVSCAPTSAAVWGISYQSKSRGPRPHARPGAPRAVLLQLTDGAQVVFGTGRADAVCAALHTHRSAIARV